MTDAAGLEERDLNEATARGMGLVHVGRRSKASYWADQSGKPVSNHWDPKHDANQAMMLWDDMVKRGLPVTLQEAPGEPTACYYGAKFVEASTKNEAICLAFLRAKEQE